MKENLKPLIYLAVIVVVLAAAYISGERKTQATTTTTLYETTATTMTVAMSMTTTTSTTSSTTTSLPLVERVGPNTQLMRGNNFNTAVSKIPETTRIEFNDPRIGETMEYLETDVELGEVV